MTAQLLDGEAVYEVIKADLTERVKGCLDAGVQPGLGTILVGDDGPSANYVAMKHRDCEIVGIASHGRHLEVDATADELAAAVDEYNANPEVDAYLVQYPIPPHLSYLDAIERMDPAKDVDGLHPVNLGRLVMGEDGPRPCTPAGIIALLEHYGIDLGGRHVVIVGRGLTIGRPLANLVTLKTGANAAVSVVHTGVADIGAFTRRAEVLVAAAGSPHMITPDMVKPGVVAVGAGVTMDGRKVISDLHPDVAEVAAWITPRLGGVGAMTRARLLTNAVEAAERRAGRR